MSAYRINKPVTIVTFRDPETSLGEDTLIPRRQTDGSVSVVARYVGHRHAPGICETHLHEGELIEPTWLVPGIGGVCRSCMHQFHRNAADGHEITFARTA